MKRTWCLVLLVVGCGKGAAPTMAMPDLGGATSMDGGDPLDGYVRAHMKTAMVPGLAAVVVKNDQVVLSRGWGTADLTDGRPATAAALEQTRQIIYEWWKGYRPHSSLGDLTPSEYEREFRRTQMLA